VGPLFHPRIMSVRTGRLENLLIEQWPPTPTGELHHRVLRFYASSTHHHHWRNAPPGASRDCASRHKDDSSS